jgi:hypothetical protein
LLPSLAQQTDEILHPVVWIAMALTGVFLS